MGAKKMVSFFPAGLHRKPDVRFEGPHPAASQGEAERAD
jgi:hypothetical protein